MRVLFCRENHIRLFQQNRSFSDGRDRQKTAKRSQSKASRKLGPIQYLPAVYELEIPNAGDIANIRFAMTKTISQSESTDTKALKSVPWLYLNQL
jgi:hypothetical protein